LACDDREALHAPDLTWARMLSQRRGDPYAASSAFPDGKVMRAPPSGAVARDDDHDDPPPRVTRELVEHGRARFEIVCATCHGVGGDGDSAAAAKMTLRKPPSLHEPRIRALPPERIFTIIRDGYGLMPGHAERLDAHDRWAVVAYVRALQLSRQVAVADLSASDRARLAQLTQKEGL
jgi:mono/diheme cytochrome c family protein